MWILLEQSLTKEKGREIYFKGWSALGPETTDKIDEAHQFDSEQACEVSAAYRIKYMSFVPIEVQIQVVKSKAAA